MIFNDFFKRRTAALILLAIMSSLLLFACGEENPPADDTTTTSDESTTTTEAPPTTTEEVWDSVIPKVLRYSTYDLEEVFSATALKDAYADYFTVGVAINGNNASNAMIQSAEMREIAKYHFNGTVYSNLTKSSYILDQSGSQNIAKTGDQTTVAVKFDSCIAGLDYAKENGMKMRWHTLVWHTQVPEWFFKVDYNNSGDFVDKDTMLARLESYIKQVCEFVETNYPGVIVAWDVVNEAVETASGQYDNSTGWYTRVYHGNKVDNLWYKVIGPDYVEKAFEYARKYTGPDAKLFYNDYNTFDPTKNKAICNLVSILNEKGLIDGIGMQMHVGLTWPNSVFTGNYSIKTAIQNFSQFGLEIQLTELSVDGITQESQFEAQAQRYKDVFTVCLEMSQVNGGPANITSVTLFGLMDHYLLYDNNTDKNWLFGADLKPKPAFYAVLEAVAEFEEKQQSGE